MVMQLFATLFIGSFITLTVIGLVAVLHGLFVRPAEPDLLPQAAEQNGQLPRDQQLA
jgi:hypothetical protein